MGRAYTPGLEVSEDARLVRVRELPLAGRALVRVGDRTTATTPVLAAELPGDLDILRIADRLGLDPDQVASGVRVKVGESVQAGDVLCQVKSFFGLFTSEVKAPHAGQVEFFTEANGHLAIRQPPIPFQISAYLDGTVMEVDETKSVTIESTGAIIQGIFGVGGERFGTIYALDVDPDTQVRPEHLSGLQGKLQGAVLIGGSSFDQDALGMLVGEGVQAVMTGSIDAETLRVFVGHEIGVSITGDENVPFTLIITEGFGALPISRRIVDLARKLHGKFASVNGATQVRAGAIRPEVIVSTSTTDPRTHTRKPIPPKNLDVRSRVRLIRVPYFGLFGTVTHLIHEPQQIDTGAHVRVIQVQLDQGPPVTIPRANVELV